MHGGCFAAAWLYIVEKLTDHSFRQFAPRIPPPDGSPKTFFRPAMRQTNSRLLVVEDELKTLRSIEEGLKLEGWEVVTAETGRQAMHLIDVDSFDLVLLDWMVPEGDGMDVIKHLRDQGRSTPVLMLTARDSLNDRVHGLDAGADDYLVKPFAFPELVARSRALLRRQTFDHSRFLSFEDLRLDTRLRTVTRAGVEIPLSQRETDLLEYLMRNLNRVVTREMLQRDVWREPGRFTSIDNVIDVQMTRLRKKINESGAEKLIHTIRGLGFRLGRSAS